MTIDGDARPLRRLIPAFVVALLLIAFLLYEPAAGPPDSTTQGPTPRLIQPIPGTPVGWQTLPPGPLSPRTDQATVWTGSQMIVWGGTAIAQDHATGAVYSPEADPGRPWQSMPPAPLDGGAGPATAWTGREAFVFTGATALYSLEQDRWRSLADPPVSPSHPLAAAWTGREVILVGYEQHPPHFADNVFAVAYGPEGRCCRRLPDPPIDLSYGHLIWTGDDLLLIGGFRAADDSEDTIEFAAYDPDRDTWTELPPPPLSGGGEVAASWTGASLIAVDYNLQTARWQPESGWSRLPKVPFEFASCFPRTAAIGTTVFVWYCRNAALYDQAGEVWLQIAAPELDPHAVSTSCLPIAATATVLMWCGNGDGAEPFFWEIDPTAVEVSGR